VAVILDHNRWTIYSYDLRTDEEDEAANQTQDENMVHEKSIVVEEEKSMEQ
jgi:hypothetical protein